MKISVSRIQKELFKYYREKGYLWFSSNTYALGHEADFIAISSSKIVHEIEIKRSKSDYWADFKNKELKHSILKFGKYPVNYFYFCCESDLIQPEEVPYPYGLIHIEKQQYIDKTKEKKKVCYRYKIMVVKKAYSLHKKPLEDYYLIKALNSVVYKYFNNLKIKG